MSDDDRQRRRLGDATKDRIADLAEGWSVPAQAPVTTPKKPTPGPAPAPAQATPVAPRFPTDPGDVAPTAPYEKADDGFEDARPTTVAAPPPEALDVLRGKAPSYPPDSGIHRSLTAFRADPPRTRPPPPPGSKRPTSPPPTPPARPANVAVEAAAPGRDDDATTVEPPPRTDTPSASAHVVAGLRDAPVLRRRPGVLGQFTYVFTVWAGVRRARRELATVDAELRAQKTARAERLAELGRAAVGDDRFDQTSVRASRDNLADIEERRSRHAGASAASDAELEAIDRERDREERRLETEIEGAEQERTRLDGELAPLERTASATRKRGAELKATLAAIEVKVAAAKASLVSVKGPKLDRAGVEAELATLHADRQAVSRDEPAIVAALDDLLPQIASRKAARADAEKVIADARVGQERARARAADEVAAVQARRKVEERAVADAQTDRDRALVDLGERLYTDRPRDLTRKVDAVEQRDVAIATAERRAIELRELIASVERGALVRSILLWLLVLGAIAAAVIFILTR